MRAREKSSFRVLNILQNECSVLHQSERFWYDAYMLPEQS